MKAKLIAIAVVAAAAVTFGGVLDNAWIKGTTDKNPLFYKPGEKIVFTLTPQQVEGDLPDGKYFLQWKRSGDDGLQETGTIPFTKAPFVYETKIDKPGFVRLEAYVVDAKGSRYAKKFTGAATTPEGKAAMNRFERQKKSVFFDGGAGVEIDSLTTYPEPKDFDAFWKRQFARLDRVQMKADKIEI